MSESSVEEAVKSAAEQSEAASETVQAAAAAQATESIAAAAAVSVAAADAASSLAKANAAETINDVKGDMEWLQQHATQTASSLSNLDSQMQELKQSIPQAFERIQASVTEALNQISTPPKLTVNETVEEINPPNKSEEEDDQREAEKSKKKKVRRWL